MKFGRVLTAMVTPFKEDGQIDYKRVESIIDHLLKNGTDALVLVGTTGEASTLTSTEKEELFKFCIQYVDSKVPIIAGVGTNNTAESVKATKLATELGVDGVMAVVPFYNKPSKQGVISHFKAIAAATPLPVMLYNVPGRTGINMDSQTAIELSKVENIMALKEASGDLEQIAEIITHTDDDFSVYCGDDALLLPALSIGCVGIVSVASHVCGHEFQTLIRSYQNGKVSIAAKLHQSLLPLLKALTIAPNTTCIKYALQLKGIESGYVRLPLVELSKEEKNIIKKEMKLLP
ncbi:4-hydroxy-tetrahydrodipicolinate synthase [Alkalihalobacillus trypoxylicola]|uniref:4-hydroxy-tetrahydrodipicolinate synthase n=1 Tax=Alkalihalobacillus trypoxylicola TaxID=519424 RepID=UPI0009EF42A1|nr:4-hydroxy-tetrahydrodipicolinate synthase [Alkalihalobacillus trypoxylicola]